MQIRSFLALAAVTVAVAWAAATAIREPAPASGPAIPASAPLVPGLAQAVNQVVALKIQAARETVTLNRPGPDSAAWRVAEKDGFPAAVDEIKRVILALAEARTLEPRTAKPELYAKLGVDEPEQKDSSAVRVTLTLAGGQNLPPLLIGRTATAAAGPDRPATFYARLTGEASSWLAEGRLSGVPAEAVHWLDKNGLPTLPRERVQSVTTRHPDGVTLAVSRVAPDQKDFALAGLPPEAKPRQGSVNLVADALAYLSVEDVARDSATPAADAVVTELRSFDGVVLTVTLSRPEGKPWVTLTAAFDAAAAARSAGLKAPSLLPADEAEAAVKAMQARIAGWRFRISDYAASDFARRPDELIQKDEAAPAKPGP